MPQRIRTSVGFSRQSDQELVATAGAVIKGMTGNNAFPSPPVDLAALQAALDELNAAIAAQAHGGPAATADKNNKRETLIDVLLKLGQYVQLHCGNDLAVLLSSGFSAATSTRTRTPLDKPAIVSVDNGNTTQLLVKVSKIANARCYELRSSAIGAGGAPAPWQSNGAFTNSRSMPVNGLTPGITYAIQARAVGGSTGYSDWSDSVSHMCM